MISAEAKEWWENFLLNFQKKYGEITKETQWILKSFVPVNERHSTLTTTVGVIVSEKILKQSKSSKEFRKVRLLASCIMCNYNIAQEKDTFVNSHSFHSMPTGQ